MADGSEAECRAGNDGEQHFGKITWRVRGNQRCFEVQSRTQPGHIYQFQFSRTLKGVDYYRCSDCTAAAAGDQRLFLACKAVKVRDGTLLSDPDKPGGAPHICLNPAQLRPRPQKKRQQTPDSDEETTYGIATRVHATIVSCYSRNVGRTLFFKYIGESKKEHGAQEFFCIGCAERDASYDCRVFVRDGQFVALDPYMSDRKHLCCYERVSTETIRKYAADNWHDEALRRAEVLSKIPKPPSGPQGYPTPQDAAEICKPTAIPAGYPIPQDRRIETSAPMTPVGGPLAAADVPLKKACFRLLADVPRRSYPGGSARTEEAEAQSLPEESEDNAEPKPDVCSPNSSKSSVYSVFIAVEETDANHFDPTNALSMMADDELTKIDFEDDEDVQSTTESSRRRFAREESERRRINESFGGDSVGSVSTAVNVTAFREALDIESSVGNVEEADGGADLFEEAYPDGVLDDQQAAGTTDDAVGPCASTNVDDDACSSAADTNLSVANTEIGTIASCKKKGKIVFGESDEEDSDDEENSAAPLEEDDDDVKFMGITKAEPGSIAELSSRRRHRSPVGDQAITGGIPGPSRLAHDLPSMNFGPAKYSDDGKKAYFTDLMGHEYTFEILTKNPCTGNGRVIEVRTFQCLDCRRVLPTMGRPMDLPKIKVVDGFFTDIDPFRPQGNEHLCTKS